MLVLTVVTALLALLLPRPLPTSTRSLVWGTLLLIMLGIVANIDRFSGTANATLGGFPATPYDRIATVMFGAGLAMLFYPLSNHRLTIIAMGLLPTLTLAVERADDSATLTLTRRICIIVLFLMVFASLLRWPESRKNRTRASGFTLHEWRWRILLPLLWLLLTVVLTPLATVWARLGRTWLYEQWGQHPVISYQAYQRGRVLSVAPPTGDMGRNMRLLLEIDGEQNPVYLRETVFRNYAKGSWTGRSNIGHPLTVLLQQEGVQKSRQERDLYGLSADADPTRLTPLLFRPLRPERMASLCLPGTTRIIAVDEDLKLTLNSDGIAQAGVNVPGVQYEVYTVPRGEERAFPWPQGSEFDDYLAIPEALTNSVVNWVAQCAGLSQTASAATARTLVESFFVNNFTYSLTPQRQPGARDSIAAFMFQRAGHCTLFASAATLMLRKQGFPARMVSGFYCSERHALTGQWVVRERDAHAWCEVWDAAAGCWLLVEATPATALPDIFPDPARWRLTLEQLSHLWRQFLDRLRNANPIIALALLLADVFTFVWDVAWSPAGLAVLLVLLGWLALRYLRRRQAERRIAPELRLRLELVRTMQQLQKRRLPAHRQREPDESWSVWWQRCQAHLPEAEREIFGRLLEQYQSLRYQPQPDPAAMQRWIAAATPDRRRKSGK